jgi:hypothetical protein
MIRAITFWEALSRRKTFVATNRRRGVRYHKKLRNMENKYLNLPGIPESELRDYIRLQLRIELGQILSIRGLNRKTLDFDTFPELETAWNQPIEAIKKV